MHAERPLQTDHAALDGLYDRERRYHRDWRPDSEMHPHRQIEGRVRQHVAANDDVAENEDHQIGRQIVGALMEDLFAAYRTMIDWFQECLEELAGSATWAAVEHASGNRSSNRTLAFVGAAIADGGI